MIEQQSAPVVEAAPVVVATDASPAVATPVVPAAPSLDLKGMSKRDHAAAIEKVLEERRSKSSPPPAESTGNTAASATSDAEPAKVEPSKPATDAEKSDDDPDLEAARRLNQIAQESRRAAENRAKAAQALRDKEADLARKEADIAAREKKESDLSVAISKARAAGKRVDILRAAGVSEEELRGTFFLDAMEEFGHEAEAAEKSGAPAPTLTEDKVRELLKAAREEERKELERRQAEDKAAHDKASKDRYFGSVVDEFKKGEFPILRAIRPSEAELDAHFHEVLSATGEALPPGKLLRSYEDRLIAAGVTVTPKAKPGGVTPPPPPAATSRTITATATSDVRSSPPEPTQTKPRTAKEVRDEGFKKWQESRGVRA